jgi:hypothetical protein
MKKVLFSICIGSLALAITAWGQTTNTNDVRQPRGRHSQTTSKAERAAPTNSRRAVTNTQPVRSQRYISTAPSRQRSYVTTPRTNVNANASARYNTTGNARFQAQRAQRSYVTTPRTNVNANASARYNTTGNARFQAQRAQNFRATSQARVGGNVTVNRERNFGMNRNVPVRGRANAMVTNNWRGAQFSGRQYAAFRDYHRTWHDRGWWRSHYSRISFVSGGWWYWNAGYWYPAWGYDSYAYYPYDGPIYGYSDLGPDQIVSEVQAQLQRDGYYNGPIDGVLGPMTREAIAAFQADNGLAVTSTVDEPTLSSLGLA